jgi:hypothetical protein
MTDNRFVGWIDVTRNVDWAESKAKLQKVQMELAKHYGEKVLVWGGGGSGYFHAILKSVKILPTFIGSKKGFALKAYLKTENKMPFHDSNVFDPWIGSWQISVREKQSKNPEMLLTSEQQQEIARLQSYFPYRIVYGMIDKDSGKFESHAVTSMRIPNKLAREGHKVFVMKNPVRSKRNPVIIKAFGVDKLSASGSKISPKKGDIITWKKLDIESMVYKPYREEKYGTAECDKMLDDFNQEYLRFTQKVFSKNPVGTSIPSSSLYQSFHGKPVQSQRMVQFNPPKGNVVKIGKVSEIIYTVEGNSKFDGTSFSHKAGDLGHKMLPSNTLLVSSEDGKELYLIRENSKSKYPVFSSRGVLG